MQREARALVNLDRGTHEKNKQRQLQSARQTEVETESEGHGKICGLEEDMGRMRNRL